MASSTSGVRGERTDDDNHRSFRDGVDPLPCINPNGLADPDWMGLDWTAPVPFADALDEAPETSGVYRIWDPTTCPPLEYIGESVSLRNRLAEHRRNRDGDLCFSCATLTGLNEKFQLSQVESELLGAHWLACQTAPRTQY